MFRRTSHRRSLESLHLWYDMCTRPDFPGSKVQNASEGHHIGHSHIPWKVLVASLLSCSLVVTERQIWVQHLGWCELVLCSLICNIKSFWLGMLNAAQDCLQAGAVSICPSDKIIWFEKHVTLCVNFLKDHHNGLCNCIHLNLKPCPQRASKCATIQLSKHIIHVQSADIQTAIPQCKELQPVLADLPLLQSMFSTAGYL